MLAQGANNRFFTAVLFLIIPALAILAGCGGGGSMVTPIAPVQGTSASQPVSVSVSDDPGASVVSFTVTINAINLVNSAGASVPLLSSPATVEFTHLAGNSLPLGTATVPAGTYNRAEVTLANPAVTYINSGTGLPVQRTLPASPVTIPVPLNPPLVISNAGVAINFDLSVFGSVNIDAAGNVTFTPQFTPSTQPLPLPTTLPSVFPLGTGFEHVTGNIATVSGSSFTLTAGTQTLKFVTNSTTHYSGITGISALTPGMLVIVDAVIQQDGTLLAVEVRTPAASGVPNMFLFGLVTSTSGTPVTSFQIVPQQLVGVALPLTTSVALGLTAQVSSNTAFTMDTNVDLRGLPFTAAFDRNNLFSGQNVQVTSSAATFVSSGVPSFLIQATEVELEQQAMVGTVANLGNNAFTLNLATGSAFTTITKAASITVFRQTTTGVSGVTLANGAQVLVRGLVFKTGSGYSLVASRISQP